MSSTNKPWFIAERSEAIAGLLLTARKDVSVESERKHDDGVDFLVDVGTGGLITSQFFVVQVKGTTSSDPNDWMKNVQQLFPASGSQVSLPACVFVINVRDNQAFYAWAAKPSVGMNSAKLRFFEKGDFRPLDAAAVDDIINQVKAYYEALPKQLMPT